MAKLAAGKKTPLKRLESSGSQTSGSQASASQATATLRQQAKEQLAIEDAKEKDQLLIKAEEAVKGHCLPYIQGQEDTQCMATNCSGPMHCKHLEDLKVAVEEYTAQLESITINGTVTGES